MMQPRLLVAFLLLPLSGPGPATGEEETCLDCHPEYLEALGGTHGHEPFVQEQCEECHVFHGFRERMELRDSQTVDLCSTCHLETIDLPEEDLHSPVVDDESCLTCHVPHASEHESLLSTAREELCLDCHDGPDDVKGRLHPPFAERACVDCHDPHGSLFPSFLRMPAHYVCLGCHDEILGDKAPEEMHAFDEDRYCGQCHRGHAGTVRGLLTADLPGLCVGCHEDLGDIVEKGRAHSALLEGNCLDCHQAHFEGNSSLLSPAPRLCFECHAPIRERLQRAVVHEVAEECDSCHDPHERHAPGAQVDLCADCHEVDDDDFRGRHAGQTPEQCTECHDPHGSESGVLLRAFQHEPFADGDCDTCHDEGPDRLRSEGLCLDCHDQPEPAGGHSASKMGGKTCVDCHTPHAASRPHLVADR